MYQQVWNAVLVQERKIIMYTILICVQVPHEVKTIITFLGDLFKVMGLSLFLNHTQNLFSMVFLTGMNGPTILIKDTYFDILAKL